MLLSFFEVTVGDEEVRYEADGIQQARRGRYLTEMIEATAAAVTAALHAAVAAARVRVAASL